MAEKEIEGIDVEEVIDKIKRAILSSGAKNIKVKSFELTLKTIITTGTGGELNFKIPVIDTGLDLSGTLENQISQEIYMKFGELPSRKEELIRREPFGTVDIEDDLYSIIQSLEKAVIIAYNTEPRFNLKEAHFNLDFIMAGERKINLIIKSEKTMKWMNNLKVNFGLI